MSDKTVWGINKSDDEQQRNFVYTSLTKDYVSRFGWSYRDDLYIPKLKERIDKFGWASLDEKEQDAWKGWFLLSVKKGDWVVHVGVPTYGHCVAGIVKETYKYDDKSTGVGLEYSDRKGDFRHMLVLDKDSIIEFERGDKNILPSVNLNLRQRWQRILDVEGFEESIDNLKKARVVLPAGVDRGLFHLREAVQPKLLEITRLIHDNHKSAALEPFFCNIFKRLPNVVGVQHTGGPNERGADIVVTYKSGIPLAGLEDEKTLVVQIKSHFGHDGDLRSVEQIKTAFAVYKADAGLIISTADTPSPELITAIESLADTLKKPIGFLIGEEVAKFVLKHNAEFLIGG
jgi:hypothetical protein